MASIRSGAVLGLDCAIVFTPGSAAGPAFDAQATKPNAASACSALAGLGRRGRAFHLSAAREVVALKLDGARRAAELAITRASMSPEVTGHRLARGSLATNRASVRRSMPRHRTYDETCSRKTRCSRHVGW